ncbi:MAG: diaminopimelate decarboxylase [Spirochaetes bacterium]|nr:diaminopimelate decarboxylase [Spirochaetota bacterium]
MDYFQYKNNVLYAEDINLLDVAEKVKTPFYLYSKKTILRHFHQIKEAFKTIDPLICFSVKTNFNIEVLKILKNSGAGFDIVSGGELYLTQKVKASPQKIVYAGVGKTADEIRYAIQTGILMFNCESIPEMRLMDHIAGKMNKTVSVAVRINPDITPRTHEYIITGKKETKFGISIYEIDKIIRALRTCSHLRLKGLHFHIGSQITETSPYEKALEKVIKLVPSLRQAGFPVEYFNIGGGLGIIYKKEKVSLPHKLAKKIIPVLKKHDLKMIMEPGRYIVGNAGILVTRISYIKQSLNKKFVIVDAGMQTLIRPTLYTAYHEILPLKKSIKTFKVDVVGPICETGDFFARDRKIPVVHQNEFLAIKGAGAYGMVMASRYNAHPFPAEILVDNDRFKIVKKAQTYRDLLT